MKEEQVYIPVKITEKKYAEQMINEGRILMRSFADFEDYDADSLYTGENDFGIHLLCMYRLMIDLCEKRYVKIDKRMRQFGDTAVIITDPEEFYIRLCRWCGMVFGIRYRIGTGDVQYLPQIEEREKHSLFLKEIENDWQNETRIVGIPNPCVKVQKEYDNRIEPWYVELGNLSDIAVMVPIEDLIERKWTLDLTGQAFEQKLQMCKKPAIGVLGSEYVCFRDYRDVCPSTENIDWYMQTLDSKVWIPLTEMRSLVPGGKQIPMLKFEHIDRKQRIIFLQNRLCAMLLPGNEGLIYDILVQDLKRHAEGYEKLALIRHFNIGETEREYQAYQQKQASFQRNFKDTELGDVTEIDMLMIQHLQSKNIYGLDIESRNWVFQTEISMLQHADNVDHIRECYCKIEERMQRKCGIIMESEDIYGGFQTV